MSDVPLPIDQPRLPRHTHDSENPVGSADEVLDMHVQAMREMEDPHDGVSPSPVSLLLACFLLMGWGGYYMATNDGNWDNNQYASRAPQGPAAAPAPVDMKALGAEVYGTCVQCHQANALGLPDTYPPLSKSEYVTGDPRRLAAILLNGLGGPVTVEGKTYSGTMPPWRDQFSDQDIAAVLTHIRGSFGNQASPVETKLVTEVRKATEGQVSAWTVETLQAWAAKPR